MTARVRWRILREAVYAKGKRKGSVGSVPNLLRLGVISYGDGSPSAVGVHSAYLANLEVRYTVAQFTLNDLVNGNNTGNVCIWPSEEVMAYWCLVRREAFEAKAVCELGAGMVGLASLFLAVSGVPKLIAITDGNPKCVANIRTSFVENRPRIPTSVTVICEELVWGMLDDVEKFKSQFDVVLAADCLFFVDFHEKLLYTVHFLLRPTGRAFLWAPRRSGSLEKFVELARRMSTLFRMVTVKTDYDDSLSAHRDVLLASLETQRISEQLDHHYPILVELIKGDELTSSVLV
uniref:Calmodulin-lysine N-methyltransferase n=1 Tax=Trichuris muris TaxID=70415 RepID=A0A5S6Q7M8_TRIMR